MQTSILTQTRHLTRRQAALKQIGRIGPFLEGSLCAVKRPGCAEPGWHLTFKTKGRTSTVYVPMELVADVKLWTQNYQRLRKRIREVTRHSLGLVRGHAFKPSGHYYYLRQRSPQPRMDNAFLVGDAAGLATLDLGEGIRPAIQSGLLAADAILHGGEYSLKSIPKYSWASILRPRIGKK